MRPRCSQRPPARGWSGPRPSAPPPMPAAIRAGPQCVGPQRLVHGDLNVRRRDCAFGQLVQDVNLRLLRSPEERRLHVLVGDSGRQRRQPSGVKLELSEFQHLRLDGGIVPAVSRALISIVSSPPPPPRAHRARDAARVEVFRHGLCDRAFRQRVESVGDHVRLVLAPRSCT